MRPLAIIPIYNEADILPAVLTHLEQQGCDVYVLDNWSTDLSHELVTRLGDNVERWPAERPTNYEWTAILTRIEEIALERGKGRWVILHDADEIRRVPTDWSTLTLEKALEIVSITGYNAVHFRVRTFVPTDNLWTAGADPERHFRYHRSEHVDHGIPHVKAWFQGEDRVDLHTHGGHQVMFPDRHVCPHPFILKHYPIRSQEHGERKVLKERFPRYPEQERSKRWHVQYDEYVAASTPSFVVDAKELCRDKNNTTIVAVTDCAERFHRLADSIEQHDASHPRIVVACGVAIDRRGWKVVSGGESSDFASNIALGIAAAGTDDVLLVRDDIELIGPIVEELSDVAYLTSAAVVSAQIIGEDGLADSAYRVEARWRQKRQHVALACALLRRDSLTQAVENNFPSVVCRCRVKQHSEKNPQTNPHTSDGAGLLALADVEHCVEH
jgi:glycosyltransferase involved in cell wall biosynthesis